VRKLVSGIAGDMCSYSSALLLNVNHWKSSPQDITHSKEK